MRYYSDQVLLISDTPCELAIAILQNLVHGRASSDKIGNSGIYESTVRGVTGWLSGRTA